MGIRITKKDEMSSNEREKYKSDAFHKVCLGFEVFCGSPGNWQRICQRVYSNTIYDSKYKQTGPLKIEVLSEVRCAASGGVSIFMFVENVQRGKS